MPLVHTHLCRGVSPARPLSPARSPSLMPGRCPQVLVPMLEPTPPVAWPPNGRWHLLQERPHRLLHGAPQPLATLTLLVDPPWPLSPSTRPRSTPHSPLFQYPASSKGCEVPSELSLPAPSPCPPMEGPLAGPPRPVNTSQTSSWCARTHTSGWCSTPSPPQTCTASRHGPACPHCD